MEKNIVLGSGKLYFDPFKTGTTTYTGEMYFGNTTEFKLNGTSEVLKHYNTDDGLKQQDDSVQTSVAYAGSFTTDNISAANLAMFFLGEEQTVTQVSGSVSAEVVGPILVDRFYQLGKTAANPAGVRGVSSVVVKSFDAATTYTLGTDYTVDAELGRIYIVAGGPLATAIAAAKVAQTDLKIKVDYTRAANSRSRVISKGQQITGALHYVAKNAKGSHRDVYVAYVTLTPNGDYDLKGDDWQKLQFNVEVSQLDSDTPAVIADGRPL